MKYTEVFLKRFTTGENATQLRQTLGLSLEEVNFMIAEIDGTNDVSVSVVNDLDAVDDSFAIALEAPECKEFDSLKFLFYGVNQGTYAATIQPSGETNVTKLDKKIQIIFAPTP